MSTDDAERAMGRGTLVALLIIAALVYGCSTVQGTYERRRDEYADFTHCVRYGSDPATCERLYPDAARRSRGGEW